MNNNQTTPTSYFDNKTAFLEPCVEQYGSHMVMSNVKRTTRQKYLNIDTRFADDYGYNKMDYNKTNSFNFTFPERIRDVKSMRVTSLELPISFYNFAEYLGNTTLNLTDVGTSTTKTVVVKDGNYLTTTQLSSEITDKIHNFGGNFTDISFSMFENKFSTFDTSDSSFTVSLETDISGNTDKNNFRSKLGWELGFRIPEYSLITVDPFTSESFVNLNTVRYLYLVLDEFSSGFTNSFVCPIHNYLLNKKILARITVDTQRFPFGTVQPCNFFNGLIESDFRQYNGTIDIQKMSIQIVNEYGKPINLNGMDFSFLLELTYE
jgi:hypothetical protein